MNKINEMTLWKAAWGRIPTKPVKAIDLGDGFIKVIGSCLIKQKRDDFNESYHDTYKEALIRLLTNAQRDVNNAKKKLASSQRHLDRMHSKWINYLSAPNDNDPPTKT